MGLADDPALAAAARLVVLSPLREANAEKSGTIGPGPCVVTRPFLAHSSNFEFFWAWNRVIPYTMVLPVAARPKGRLVFQGVPR